VTTIRRTTALLTTLLAVAALAAGCGSSSNNNNSGGGGGGGANPAVAPSVNNAVDQCLKQAKQVQQADARKTAVAACNAAKSGDTSKVKSAAKQQCLNAVKQIPDSAKEQKKLAQQRCDAIK
jgi:hypothetical protein